VLLQGDVGYVGLLFLSIVGLVLWVCLVCFPVCLSTSCVAMWGLGWPCGSGFVLGLLELVYRGQSFVCGDRGFSRSMHLERIAISVE